MRAYKFLAQDGHSVYSGVTWPTPSGLEPGDWMTVEAVDVCRTGIHACRPADLAYWLNDALYEIELEGDVTEVLHKVAASRGRLLRRIEEYPSGVRELCEVSAWRTRDRAVDQLRAEQLESLADAFGACRTLDALEALGPTIDAKTASSTAGRAALVAADCAHWAPLGPVQHSPFIAAVAAGYANGDFDSGFAHERRFQSQWLADRLGLE